MTPNSMRNQIRQVLHNEVGVTKKDVRNEIESIVKEQVFKQVAAMNANDAIERIVRKQFDGMFKFSGLGRRVDAKIEDMVYRAIKEVVAERLTVEVTNGKVNVNISAELENE